MAANIPAKLRAADLTWFIIRASQLETAKPVVAYWCQYWIVNQILAKGLHNGDAETLSYTTNLMDKLEEIKTENSSNDAIIDDVAGQAYIEQFSMETFQRANRAVEANKVTKQTADTFQASATFFELINIWNAPDAETQAKIKYAKWNAVRIAKALKEGKDPNESNPKQESTPDLPILDPDDPEVQALHQPARLRQASVEEVPDEQDRLEAHLAKQSFLDHSLHPSAQVSARGSPGPPRGVVPNNTVKDDNVSPLESPNTRNSSIGGGYFPEVPTVTSEPGDSTLADEPSGDILDLGLPDHPVLPPGSNAMPDLGPLRPPTIVDSPFALPPVDFYTQAPQSFPPPQPQQHYAPPAPPQQPSYRPAPIAQYQIPPTAPAPAPVPLKNAQFNTDDVAIAKAQKHAKWAISALNFEDAETAVRELRAALQTLGAQ